MVHVIGVLISVVGTVILQLAVNLTYGTGPVSQFPFIRYQDALIYYLTPAALFSLWIAAQVKLFKFQAGSTIRLKHWLWPICIWLAVLTPVAILVGRPG